jgi:hypothetical protein
MNVHDGLPRGWPDIDADVVSRWHKALVEAPPGCVKQIHEAGYLSFGKLEEVLNVTFDDDKRVSRRYRERIIDDKSMRTLFPNAVGGHRAERTITSR